MPNISIVARILFVFLTFFSSSKTLADKADELYWALVDRRNDEEHIMSNFSIASIKENYLNRVFGKGSEVEDSILRISTYRNFENVVEKLLASKADPNIKLKNNCSPLGTAISNSNGEMVLSLLDYSADTRLPICWNEGSGRIVPVDRAIVQYELPDEVRMAVMRKHVSLGEPLSQRVLSFAIFNDKPDLVRLFVELMPDYRSDKMLNYSKSRSKEIYSILKGSWSSN